jgi:hypothetical protein
MPNNLDIYDPLFYANEALIQLEKALGMAGRIYRDYDPSPQQKGSTIKVRRPSVFTAQDAPSTAQDILASHVDIVLDTWREVKFGLTDKELTFTKEDIIREHIRPAAYALADDIDSKLVLLHKDVPWFYDLAATTAVGDLTGPRKIMMDNKVPFADPEMMHYMVNPALEAGFLNLDIFHRADAAGDGGATQQRGTLGRKFGFEIFTNQNVATHTPGVSADSTGALVGNHAAGSTTITFDGVTAAGTFKAGDTFVITGDSQRYAFAADATADGTGVVPATAITPPLAVASLDNAVVTVRLDAHVANLVFHRNAFALAMAPLSTLGNQLGARIETISDPITNLSLRSRLFYEGNNSKVFVALDVLFGKKTLDGNLAVVAAG